MPSNILKVAIHDTLRRARREALLQSVMAKAKIFQSAMTSSNSSSPLITGSSVRSALAAMRR